MSLCVCVRVCVCVCVCEYVCLFFSTRMLVRDVVVNMQVTVFQLLVQYIFYIISIAKLDVCVCAFFFFSIEVYVYLV